MTSEKEKVSFFSEKQVVNGKGTDKAKWKPKNNISIPTEFPDQELSQSLDEYRHNQHHRRPETREEKGQ